VNAAGGEAAHSERKLRRRDKLFLVAALLLGAASLAVGFALYPRVNPEASIRFTADRGESEQIARRFLAARDLDVAGRRHASRFLYDDEAKVFLERSLGAARANELMADSVRMWRWGHRWFRPLQKEEMSVSVATTGQVAAFNHLLPEDAPGADLDPEAARALAEEFLRSSMGRDPRGLEFLEGTREKKPARTDYLFTWRSRAPNLGTGEYRVQVRIQGDRPGAYREFVHIPESWARDYAQLRSRNMAAGVAASVLLLLTFLAVVVVVIARMRTREIRWRTALIFGAVGMALQLLAGFNSLPVSLFAYDTTASFGGFLTGQIFGVFRDALLWGMAIMLLTAGGEALYRQAYPEKISLTGLFTWRGLRTRRFLLSSVLGLCATCVFFAYQEVFYATARRLGAWAPMDVPYDELLNTAFPWIFVLLIGFQPAVTEEFLSRMFSIPFLRKYTRSAFLAVVLPALIWGFAHANYPNQPFYIRGVEVGLVGIVAGLTMLRVNVLAVLVWHFTVDALLTAYLLFRSGNPYYIISAAAAGGLILLPVGYAAIAYLRRKEFAEPHPLLNGADRAPQEAERPEAVPEEPVAPVPMETGGYTRWSKRRRLGAVLAGAVSLLLLLLPEGGIRPGVRLPLRPGEVREKGAQWLRALGQEPDSFRVSQVLIEAGNDSSAEFSLKHAGLDRLRAFYGDFSPPVIWRLRYFRPLQARELRLRMDGEEGRVLAYARHLAEKDSVPTVDQDSALVLAREFLFEQGADLEGYDLQQASAARRPHRTDYTFSWETREDDPRDIGSARPRIEVVVQGSQVGEYLRSLKLPEQWMRQRNRNTLIDSLRLILSILAGGAVLGLLLWILLQAHRKGQVPWKALFRWTWPWTLIFAVGSLNNWPRLLSRYDTSVPYGGYLLIMGFGLALCGLPSVDEVGKRKRRS